MARTQVPKGHCWVIGDNVDSSRDSRTYGPQPMALIKGKVVAKFRMEGGWPWKLQMSWMENSLKTPSP